MYTHRYDRNRTTLSEEDNALLQKKKVFIAGAGGLGGYILESLLRVGVGEITIIDPDSFEESNLNRQLLSTEPDLGSSKAEAAGRRAALVNSGTKVTALKTALDKENAQNLCRDHHILMDALDNVEARLILEEAGEMLGIPLVHGAIAGWYGQVSVVMPGDRTLSTLYGGKESKGIETGLGNPSFTPAVIAGIQAGEALKVLLGKESALYRKLLYIDLLEHEYNSFDIG